MRTLKCGMSKCEHIRHIKQVYRITKSNLSLSKLSLFPEEFFSGSNLIKHNILILISRPNMFFEHEITFFLLIVGENSRLLDAMCLRCGRLHKTRFDFRCSKDAIREKPNATHNFRLLRELSRERAYILLLFAFVALTTTRSMITFRLWYQTVSSASASISRTFYPSDRRKIPWNMSDSRFFWLRQSLMKWNWLIFTPDRVDFCSLLSVETNFLDVRCSMMRRFLLEKLCYTVCIDTDSIGITSERH